MKLLSLFLASMRAQEDYTASSDAGEDRGVYYGGSYGGYGSYGSYGGYPSYGSYGASSGYPSNEYAKFTHQDLDDKREGNGLYCWRCHGRLKINEAESNTNNAWYDCVINTSNQGEHGVKECQGDERVCITEERRRNGVVTEVMADCKNPEACLYLWRRNERFTLLFHLYADQTESKTPGFIDDECRNSSVDDASNPKFKNHRAQWESTCRTCCKADTTATAHAQCNGADGDANISPLKEACGDKDCADYFSNVADRQFLKYSIVNIPSFLDDQLAHTRVHPGEGRNSLPEDKFAERTNAADTPAKLSEQADALSMEETDFHNNRETLTSKMGT